jgi:Tol biopolymer transport system component
MTVTDPSNAHPVQILVGNRGEHNHGALWSLDGRWIYFIHGKPNSGEMNVWRIRPGTNETPEALTKGLEVGSLAPLDARTLLFVAKADDGSGPWLWALDVDSKQSRRLNSGLAQYTAVSSSADGRRIVAAVANPHASLWTTPIQSDRIAERRDVQPYGPAGVRALTPRLRGDALFYLSALGAGDGLWRFAAGQSTEIWRGSQGALLEPPAISPDGLRAAIVLRKEGRRTLTLMDVDGGAPRSIAASIDVRGSAAWSPDGQWLVVGGVIGSIDNQQEGLFKIPVDGGEPVLLRKGFAVDPDWKGDVIVFGGENIAAASPLLAIRADGHDLPLPDVQMMADKAGPRFLPDGSGVVFMKGSFWAPDFWLFDFASNSVHQLTRISGDTTEGHINSFDVTPDNRLVFDRIVDNSDVVLIIRPAR